MNLTVNRLPAPTWNRLKMNECVIKDLDVSDLKAIGTEKEAAADGIDFASIPTGMGEELNRLAEGAAVTPVRIQTAAEGSTASETLRLACSENEKGFLDVQLYAKANSTLTVWMDAFSETDAKGLLAVRTKIYLEENAKVRLVQTQLLGRGYQYLNDIGGHFEKGSALEVVQLFLGAKETWAGCLADLTGKGSSLSAEIGYYGKGSQRYDMNYVALHKGKKTTSFMKADGVLRDEAFKLFRGTIDFKNGSAGAKGDETEDVLLLGEDVVNQTIPLILCAEEDVEGNHGATIGRPDEETLFYLGARGLDPEEAVNMLAKARMEAICKKIGDEDLTARVQKFLTEG